jgi:hypothetical protein
MSEAKFNIDRNESVPLNFQMRRWKLRLPSGEEQFLHWLPAPVCRLALHS